MPIKPITPKEAVNEKEIPDQVFQVFNDLIKKKLRLGPPASASFTQDEVVSHLVKKMSMNREELYANGWLDVEPHFAKAGWQVEYDKPGYNENYPATFTFTERI